MDTYGKKNQKLPPQQAKKKFRAFGASTFPQHWRNMGSKTLGGLEGGGGESWIRTGRPPCHKHLNLTVHRGGASVDRVLCMLGTGAHERGNEVDVGVVYVGLHWGLDRRRRGWGVLVAPATAPLELSPIRNREALPREVRPICSKAEERSSGLGFTPGHRPRPIKRHAIEMEKGFPPFTPSK